jgi:hypothetical protein
MKKVLLVLVTLIALIAGGIFIYEQGKQEAKSPAQLKQELKQQEYRMPSVYLTVTTNMENNIKKGNLFKRDKVDGQIITGTVKNSATSAYFKDVVVDLTYYSKTKSVIGTEQFVIYESFAPGESKNFEYRIEVPSATATYNATVGRALPDSSR